MKKKYKIDDIVKRGSCSDYGRKHLQQLDLPDKGITLREIAALDIQVNDLIWLMSQMCADDTNTVARRIALDVINHRDATDAVRRWLTTGDESIRAEAEKDADAASEEAQEEEAWVTASTWAAVWSSIGARKGAAVWGAVGGAVDAKAEAAAKRVDWAKWVLVESNETWATMRAALVEARADVLAAKRKYLRWMIDHAEFLEDEKGE